jgi:hypothetical protein
MNGPVPARSGPPALRLAAFFSDCGDTTAPCGEERKSSSSTSGLVRWYTTVAGSRTSTLLRFLSWTAATEGAYPGLSSWSMLALTAAASNGVPSEKVTPDRSLKV